MTWQRPAAPGGHEPADSNELIEGYIAAEGFDSPYYQSLYEAGKVKALNLGVDFTAADFQVRPGGGPALLRGE